jgi:hypothetical protein
MSVFTLDLTSLETAATDATTARDTLSSVVTDLAKALFTALPGDFDAHGLSIKRVKSNVGNADFLVWENDDGRLVFLEEYATCDEEGGRYLHGDFHAWIPSPTHDDKRAFAEACAAGLLDDVRATLEEQARQARTLTESLSAVTV